MYDLHLSAEQRDIRDTVRDFVAREVKPKALAPARLEARARRLLADVLDEAAQLGLRALARRSRPAIPISRPCLRIRRASPARCSTTP
jgi:alkylation response protein AidB-like acyl-CoA dehydrogenase